MSIGGIDAVVANFDTKRIVGEIGKTRLLEDSEIDFLLLHEKTDNGNIHFGAVFDETRLRRGYHVDYVH